MVEVTVMVYGVEKVVLEYGEGLVVRSTSSSISPFRFPSGRFHGLNLPSFGVFGGFDN
jgi:hypothetical protein